MLRSWATAPIGTFFITVHMLRQVLTTAGPTFMR